MPKISKILRLVLIIAAMVLGPALEKTIAQADLTILVKKEKPPRAPRPRYVPDEIMVKFKPGARKEEIEDFARQQETKEIYESPYAHFKVLKIPKTKTVEEMLEIYRRNPNVEYAEPNYYAYASMIPNDPLYLYQWHLDNLTYGGIQMEEAWDITTGSQNVVVAVVDTGVAYENYPGLTYWHRDTYNAYGGTGYSWWCGVVSNPAWDPDYSTPPGYGNNWRDYLMHAFDLTSAIGTVTLTYQYRYDLEYSYDFAYTEVSTNNGITWTTLKTYTGDSLGWQSDSIPITTYGGNIVLLRFRVYSDDIVSDDDGLYDSDGAFFVDELRITDGSGTRFYDNVESGTGIWETTQYQKAPDLVGTTFWVNSGEVPADGLDNNSNGKIDDINGWDFINSDAHPNDDNAHGTHVTGTLAQTTNNSLGVAGVAFNTTIMPVKVLDSAGSGTYTQIIDGIYYAVNNGADIINMSLGGSNNILELENAVAYAYNNGVTVIAAAGNRNRALMDYPAAYDAYVIAVGATQYDETRAPYSNYGPSLDIVAPGGDVYDDIIGVDDGGVLQNTFNRDTTPVDWAYWFYEGTSMATPHVSGVAALLLALNPTLTPDEVRNALQSNADDLGVGGRDNTYGWGLINAYRTLTNFTYLGVLASPDNWNIGNVAPGSVTTMTPTLNTPILVQNDGNVNETFNLQITNTGGTWSAANTENGNTANTFVMSGLFSALSDSIGVANFNEGTDDDIILFPSLKTATSTIFGSSASTQNGVGVPASAGRYLWLQFKAPTSTTTSSQQTITVTVGAEQSP